MLTSLYLWKSCRESELLESGITGYRDTRKVSTRNIITDTVTLSARDTLEENFTKVFLIQRFRFESQTT